MCHILNSDPLKGFQLTKIMRMQGRGDGHPQKVVSFDASENNILPSTISRKKFNNFMIVEQLIADA